MKEKIQQIVTEFLSDKPYFLVSITDLGNKISILLDGYNGLDVSVCSKLSRFISRKSEEDEALGEYAYEVSSSGIGTDINNDNQLKGNVGRLVKLKNINGTGFLAKLIGVNELRVYLKDQKEIITVDRSMIEEVKVQVEI